MNSKEERTYMSFDWKTFRERCRKIEYDAIQHYNIRRPPKPCGIRKMRKNRKEYGFAYYDDGIAYFSPSIARLTRDDRDMIAIHEIVGHHLHPKIKDPENSEVCASACEFSFARIHGVSAQTRRDWKLYDRARMHLDRRLNQSHRTQSDMKVASFVFRSVPKRMKRLHVEIDRVRRSPGTLRFYVSRKRVPRTCFCTNKS